MNAGAAIRCWRCGAELAVELMPLRREEVCPQCDADLHVCRQCRFFNPTVSDGCDEPIAGGVSNKERANFCDYFKPDPGAFRGAGSAPDSAARDALNALFGDAGESTAKAPDDSRSELDRLFGLDPDNN